MMLLWSTRPPLTGLGMAVVNGIEAVTRDPAVSTPLVKQNHCCSVVFRLILNVLTPLCVFTAVTSTAAAAIATRQPDDCLGRPVVYSSTPVCIPAILCLHSQQPEHKCTPSSSQASSSWSSSSNSCRAPQSP